MLSKPKKPQLVLPELKLFVEWQLLNKNGDLIDKMPKRLSHSWVKNYYNALLSFVTGARCELDDDMDLRTVIGGSREKNDVLSIYNQINGWQAGSGSDVYGIWVGSDDTPENFGMGESPAAVSYQLGSKIAHGEGAGELFYQDMNDPEVSTTGTGPVTWSVAWKRYFNNASGGNVVVKEVGLVWNNLIYGGTNEQFMAARDVLGGTITMVDTSQLIVTYTLEFDLPA